MMYENSLNALLSSTKAFIVTKQLPQLIDVSTIDVEKELGSAVHKRYIVSDQPFISLGIIRLLDTKFKGLLYQFDTIHQSHTYTLGFTSNQQQKECAEFLLKNIITLIESYCKDVERLKLEESKRALTEIISKNMRYSVLEGQLRVALITNQNTEGILREMEQQRTVQSRMIEIIELCSIARLMNQGFK